MFCCSCGGMLCLCLCHAATMSIEILHTAVTHTSDVQAASCIFTPDQSLQTESDAAHGPRCDSLATVCASGGVAASHLQPFSSHQRSSQQRVGWRQMTGSGLLSKASGQKGKEEEEIKSVSSTAQTFLSCFSLQLHNQTIDISSTRHFQKV